MQNRELARLSGRAEMGFSHVSATTKSLGTCVTPGKAGKKCKVAGASPIPSKKTKAKSASDTDLHKHERDKDLAKITGINDG